MARLNEKFTGKVVWVSGAAQGIGRGIAAYFANAGAAVGFADLNREEGMLLEKQIIAGGGQAKFVAADVGNEEELMDSIGQTAALFGGLHIMVNNAAVNIIKPLHECTAAEWDWQMGVNLRAAFLSFKYAYPHLRKNKCSYVVNIGSVSSFVGQALTPGYIASKGAIHMLTKAIAIDYAAEGIRCNAVCPGITDTAMLRKHMVSEAMLQARLQRVPTGRMLTPEDIAKAVAYLSCEDSSGITGTSLIVDGGYLATAEWQGGKNYE